MSSPRARLPMRKARRNSHSRRTLARCGKSLIEVLIIVTLTSVVLAGSTTTLIALFRVDRQNARDVETRQALARLAGFLRADAHAATSCSAGADCIFALPDGESVHYTVRSGRVWRERLMGDTVLHRDSFRLTSTSAVAFELKPLGTRQALHVRIEPANETPRAAPQPFATVITAVIDLHQSRGKEAGS